MSRGFEGAKGRVALGCINEKYDDVAGCQAPFDSWPPWGIVVDKEASETTGCLTGELGGLSVPHDAPRGWSAHGSETNWCVVRARVRKPRPAGVMGGTTGARRGSPVPGIGARAHAWRAIPTRAVRASSDPTSIVTLDPQ